MIRHSLQLQSINNFHDDVILTSALRSYICYKLTVADFPSDKYTFDCKYVSFCIEFNTFIRLGIANSFLFIIFQCCYFYVMSQSTFPDQIRPRPLISCLNCAAVDRLWTHLWAIINMPWQSHVMAIKTISGAVFTNVNKILSFIFFSYLCISRKL